LDKYNFTISNHIHEIINYWQYYNALTGQTTIHNARKTIRFIRPRTFIDNWPSKCPEMNRNEYL